MNHEALIIFIGQCITAITSVLIYRHFSPIEKNQMDKRLSALERVMFSGERKPPPRVLHRDGTPGSTRTFTQILHSMNESGLAFSKEYFSPDHLPLNKVLKILKDKDGNAVGVKEVELDPDLFPDRISTITNSNSDSIFAGDNIELKPGEKYEMTEFYSGGRYCIKSQFIIRVDGTRVRLT